MADNLPYPADLQVPLSRDEIGVLQDAFDKETQAGHLSLQTRFNLAWSVPVIFVISPEFGLCLIIFVGD